MQKITVLTLSASDYRALEDSLRKLLSISDAMQYRFTLKPAKTIKGEKVMNAEIAYDNLTAEELQQVGKLTIPTAVKAAIRFR